jgi:hypothetical protein
VEEWLNHRERRCSVMTGSGAIEVDKFSSCLHPALVHKNVSGDQATVDIQVLSTTSIFIVPSKGRRYSRIPLIEHWYAECMRHLSGWMDLCTIKRLHFQAPTKTVPGL